jgi:hypothetical protein
MLDLERIERFTEACLGAGTDCGIHLFWSSGCRGDNDRDEREETSNAPQYFKAIHPRHAKVQQYAAGSTAFQRPDGGPSIRSSFYRIPIGLKAVLKDLPDIRIVVYYQDVFRHRSAFSLPFAYQLSFPPLGLCKRCAWGKVRRAAIARAFLIQKRYRLRTKRYTLFLKQFKPLMTGQRGERHSVERANSVWPMKYSVMSCELSGAIHIGRHL